MSEKDGLDNLFSSVSHEEEIFKILKIMLDPDTNLEVKTEIKKPFLFAGLKTYQNYLTSHGLKDSSGILSTFMKDSFRLHISKNRKSREEIIKAIASTSNNIEMNENNISEKNKGLIKR